MKLLFYFGILSFYLPTNDSYHVVFEQIGELASTVTYVHVKFTVDFEAIEDHIKAYRDKLISFRDKLKESNYQQPPDVRQNIYDTSAVNLQTQIIQRHIQAGQRLISNRLITSAALEIELTQLKGSMPEPSEKDQLLVQADQQYNLLNKTQEQPRLKVNLTFKQNPVLQDIANNRHARFINPLGFAFGAFGTFMGLFNQRQISNLREEIAQKHSVMIEMIQDNKRQIVDMQATLNVLSTFMSSSHLYDLSVFISEIMDIENEIRNRIGWATHALQAAQHHRLAVDFLTAEQLHTLHKKLVRQSLTLGQRLLAEKPSDLYQLETSYFYNGKNVFILLHVPMVTKHSQLRLLKLHPFPLPLNENFTITPDVKDDILAVSSGFERLSARLSAVDLLGCHSVNKMYLCDRHGVLSKELNNSCLGALYLQDFTIARDLCEFKIHPSQEVVQQLLDNWFLIHSPKVQTCFISCTNGTQQEAYLKAGIGKVHLSPGCQANLAEHRLVADGAIVLPSDITHFEWTWNAASELALNPQQLNDFISELAASGINDPTLEDISHLKINSKSKLNYLFYFLSFIFSSVAIGLIALFIFAIVTRKIIIDHKKIFPCCFQTKLIEPIEIEAHAINYPPLLNRQPQPANAPLYNLN
jgi:hypothetical protein